MYILYWAMDTLLYARYTPTLAAHAWWVVMAWVWHAVGGCPTPISPQKKI